MLNDLKTNQLQLRNPSETVDTQTRRRREQSNRWACVIDCDNSSLRGHRDLPEHREIRPRLSVSPSCTLLFEV